MGGPLEMGDAIEEQKEQTSQTETMITEVSQ